MSICVHQVTINSVYGPVESEVGMPSPHPAPVGKPADRNEPVVPDHLSDRLAWDLNVTDHCPVVKGTWISTQHIINLIVDGRRWENILWTHPELTENDIWAALAYVVAHEIAL